MFPSTLEIPYDRSTFAERNFGRTSTREPRVFRPASWHDAAPEEAPAVTLQLARERTVVGRLIDLQGQPAAGVKLIAYHNSWPYFARRFTA